ncbi:MAG TPA: type III-B CRISPR module-associated protein Cmr5 [Desulfobacterales bacterium]|nr:type III-B CRISPR module-associated protein Cmr5 [Desulfobacterales bacterium]
MRTISQEMANFAYDVMRELPSKVSRNEFASFIAGLPAMILQNGLGHTLCFLLAKAYNQNAQKYEYDSEKYWPAFEAIVKWLSSRGLLDVENVRNNPLQAIDEIIKKDLSNYLALQEETLRFLEWLKVMSKAGEYTGG